MLSISLRIKLIGRVLIKMFKIESMPAKICLGFSAMMFFLYSVSFMFFGDCNVTGGEVCFAPLNN